MEDNIDTVLFTFSLPKWLLDKVKAEAQKNGETTSAEIRGLLRDKFGAFSSSGDE